MSTNDQVPLLSVSHLSIEVARRRVLDDVCVALGPGESLSIIGASGSGKSTLLRAILGLLPHEGRVIGGQVLYRGVDLRVDGAARRRVLGSEIAMVFQHPGNYLNHNLRVRRQYEDFLRAHDVPRAQWLTLMAERLRRVGFEAPERVLAAYPFELSGGERQRVAIALSLSLSPRLILLDEPTSALDPIAALDFLNRMKSYQEAGAALIFVTHNIRAGAYLGARMLILRGGRVVETGATRDIMERPADTYTKELLSAVLEVKPCMGQR